MFSFGLSALASIITPVLKDVAYKSVKDLVEAGASKVSDMVTKEAVPEDDYLFEEDIKVIEDDNVSDALTGILLKTLPQAIRQDLDDKAKDTSRTIRTVKPYLLQLLNILDNVDELSGRIDSSIPDRAVEVETSEDKKE